MGAGQHRLRGVGPGQLSQFLDHPLHGRQQALVQAFTQHQSMGQVVDVFRGAGEVHELTGLVQLGVAGEALLEQLAESDGNG